MAEECTYGSITTPSTTTTPSWWEYNSSSISSWNSPSPWQLVTQNPSSNSSCDEDMTISTSFVKISPNHQPGFGGSSTPCLVDASSYEFIGEHAHAPNDNNIWTNVLIPYVKENYQDFSSSRKNLSLSADGAIFDDQPVSVCDYLKRMDNSATWELNHTISSISNDKPYNIGFVDDNNYNYVNNSSSGDRYIQSDVSHVKQMFKDLTLSPIQKNMISSSSYLFYDHDINVNDQDHVDHNHQGHDLYDDHNNKYHGFADLAGTNGKSFEDNYNLLLKSKLNKPLVNIHAFKSSLKPLSLSGCPKQRQSITSMGKDNIGGGGGASNEGKRRKLEIKLESVSKRPKLDNVTNSSAKIQGSKMKVRDRITTLQQIVSPFGKTDMASVLLEVIGHIKSLQEQVQLLCNPYMKTNAIKMQCPWENYDKDKMKLDLKSRGLCLVPTSSTPQIYHDNNGSDYWTSTYRGCLYR